MGVELLTGRYKGQIAGLLSCDDRIHIEGPVPGVLRQWDFDDRLLLRTPDPDLRLSKVGRAVEPLREALRHFARTWSASRPDNAIEIEFVRSRRSFRKEDRVKEILVKRGKQPCLHSVGHGAVR